MQNFSLIKLESGLKNKINRLCSFFENKTAVLMYHRVSCLDRDSQLLAVTPENFEGQIKYLSENYILLSLNDLKEALSRKVIPNKSVAITFDDGYLDNLTQAFPLLEKYQVPATIFVSSGFVDGSFEMPSDELEKCIFEKSAFLGKIELILHGVIYHWSLSEEENSLSWNITLPPKTTRQKCYQQIHQMMSKCSNEERKNIIQQLRKQTGVKGIRNNRRVLNQEELRQLAQNPLISIGAHTVNHLSLASQSLEVQKHEINDSIEDLESCCQTDIRLFAYPYGGNDAVSEETVQLARSSKLSLAFSTIHGAVSRKSNLYLLPRVNVRNWDLKIFKKHLQASFF